MNKVASIHRGEATAREMLGDIKVIDVDTHVSEWYDLWTSRAPASLKDKVPRYATKDGANCWIIGEDTFLSASCANSAIMKDGSKLPGMGFVTTELPAVHEGAHDVRARVAYMDAAGIHAQIAYPNVLGFGGQKAMAIDESLRLASISIFNDAMAEMQAESNDRIFPMALLPWWDVNKAAKEAERCHGMGLRGVNINPDPHSHGLPALYDAHWDPLWSTCAGLGMPVNFHIGASDESMSWFDSASWPGYSPGQRIAMGGVMLFVGNLRVMGNILMSGFLERHPGLKIVSVESGAGWIPYLIEAIDYMSKESDLKYSVPIKEVFRRQVYACTFFERENLIQTMRQVGVDNIMFETDFPHPACLYPDSLEYLAGPIAEMTQEERFKFFSGNAAKLYRIPLD